MSDPPPAGSDPARRAFAALYGKRGVPVECRTPELVRVAGEALAAGLAHREPAGARAVGVCPDVSLLYPVHNRFLTVDGLAEILLEDARSGPRRKGTGLAFTPGHSRNGRRREQDCTRIGWLFLDCDTGDDWHAIARVLDELGVAHVLWRTPGHAPSKPRWRLGIPLRCDWTPPADPRTPEGKAIARAEWKGRLYAGARAALTILAGAHGDGTEDTKPSKCSLDPALDQFLSRVYPATARDTEHHELTPPASRVSHQDGFGLDLGALAAWLATHGLAPEDLVAETGGRAARGRGARGAVRPWTPEDGDGPLWLAWAAMNSPRERWLGALVGNDRAHARCPLCEKHGSDTGRGEDASCVMWRAGNLCCLHTSHAPVTLADCLAVLSPEARTVYELARAEREGAQVVRRVVEALPPPPATVDLGTARGAVRDALREIAPGAALLVHVRPGTGKTHSAIALAQERAREGLRTVLVVRTRDDLRTVAAELLASKCNVRVAAGIDPAGCVRRAELDRVRTTGLSARAILCRGKVAGWRLGDPCPHAKGCTEAREVRGPRGARVLVTLHAFAPRALSLSPKWTAGDSVVVVDETPDNGTGKATLDAVALRGLARMAERVVWRHGHELGALCFALAAALDHGERVTRETVRDVLASGWSAFLGTPEGAETARVLRNRCTVPAGAELAAALERVAGLESRPNRAGRAAIVSGEASTEDLARWRLVPAVRALVLGAVLSVEPAAGGLAVTYPGAVWEALRRVNRLAILDGTPDPPALAALLGRGVEPIEAHPADAARVSRVILARRRCTRRNWCPDGHARWDSTSTLTGAVRDVVALVVERVPRGGAVLLATFQPVALDLAAGWNGDGTGPAAELLAPLREHGIALRVTHYGSRETRGSNAHEDVAATVSWGDDRRNVGAVEREARALGLAVDGRVDADARRRMGQFHERARGACRPGAELFALHVGALPPAGWYRGAVEVLGARHGRKPGGRPGDAMNPPSCKAHPSDSAGFSHVPAAEHDANPLSEKSTGKGNRVAGLQPAGGAIVPRGCEGTPAAGGTPETPSSDALADLVRAVDGFPSRRSAALHLGCTEASLRRYLTGASPVPHTLAAMLDGAA